MWPGAAEFLRNTVGHKECRSERCSIITSAGRPPQVSSMSADGSIHAVLRAMALVAINECDTSA
jgi:hypothetical protein